MAVDSISGTTSVQGRCPIDHSQLSQQKTAEYAEPLNQPIMQDADGTWHIRGYEQARIVLRSADTKQAGFKAELLQKMRKTENQPILFLDGKAHHEQRRQTARFFTPKAVSDNYRQLMERFSERLLRNFRRKQTADLSDLSMKLAVRVASSVVGLTDSVVPGIDRRLNAFFTSPLMNDQSKIKLRLHALRSQVVMLMFFYLDVKPAIKARRKRLQEDVISHLIQQNYKDLDILIECVTYGAAGMATTREFISVAAWHLLEHPDLCATYLQSDEATRIGILEELLRLEPVVGHIYRRTTSDIRVPQGASEITIPSGSLIDLHIYAINADPQAVGDSPLLICPARSLQSERIGGMVMAFGDGHHRCPGAYIALQETDIFLQRLLSVKGLRIKQKPSVTWNELTKGYELRDFMISVA